MKLACLQYHAYNTQDTVLTIFSYQYLFILLKYLNASKCTKALMTASEGEFLHLAGDTVGQV